MGVGPIDISDHPRAPPIRPTALQVVRRTMHFVAPHARVQLCRARNRRRRRQRILPPEKAVLRAARNVAPSRLEPTRGAIFPESYDPGRAEKRSVCVFTKTEVHERAHARNLGQALAHSMHRVDVKP